jgi:glycosyltransferase involved in cell wall biosynthesis/SAM-dependent methyltransferase
LFDQKLKLISLKEKAMKILLISHSTGFGGGERALINLYHLLKPDHSIEIIFPSQSGELINHFLQLGVVCSCINFPSALPDFSNYLLHAAKINFDEITDKLEEKKFDLVITNTISAPHGGIIAKKLNIAHITYVHEHMNGDDDLAVIGLSNAHYMKMIELQSDHLLCCSKYVKKSLSRKAPSSIIYPHNFSEQPNKSNSYASEKEFNILVIGVKSIRKNTHFAVTVVKALRLLGRNVSLHIVGHDSTGSHKLHSQILNKNEVNINLHPQLDDPYKLTDLKNCITLICSKVEAFGLTITESLSRKIPVVSSKSGGPEELLDAQYLFNVDDVDQCVRSITKILDNFEYELEASMLQYEKIQRKNSFDHQKIVVNEAITSALSNFKFKNDLLIDNHINLSKKISAVCISKTDILDNIHLISKEELDSNIDINQLLDTENLHPGTNVLNDIKKFDAVPFGSSKQLDFLYKNGLGLAIELASTFDDLSRLKMATTIISKIYEVANKPNEYEILSIGDGLGIDAIRFSSCGFPVDYIDYDNSHMAKIAELNFDIARKNDSAIDIRVLKTTEKYYDAVVCLEVIEHVEDIFGFIEMLKDKVKPGGLLFISECFDGIKDRWPTHLYRNENLSNLLPIVLAPYFDLIDFSKEPYCKPYIFQRREGKLITPEDLFSLINQKWISLGFLSSRQSLGI